MNLSRLLAALAITTLTVGAHAQVLYTVQESTDTLYTIDISTLTLTPVGPLGVPTSFGDLAFDTSTGTMYLVNGWGAGSNNPSSLYTVNLNTGAATLVGSTGVTSLFSLVYDPLTNKLYGAKSTLSPYEFVEINRSTGVATYVGTPSVGLDGMTFVGSTGQVVGLYAGPGSLHTLDPLTGLDSLLSVGGGFVDNCGIAWGATTNQIYSIDWSGNLFAFDVANSYARLTLTTGLGSYDGLAAAGGIAPPQTYCTAGTTGNGCVASISGTGTPSATAGSGFNITVINVEGQKQGILFYGINNTGFSPSVWGNGGTSYLCAKAPLQRMGVQNSGGTINACDGTLSTDWNTYRANNPTALGSPFAAGQVIFAQGWFRDPPSPKTTSLSNGLKFTLGP
jgi:hypothetical protein